MGVPDITASLAQADRLAGSITVPKNRHEEEMAAAAAKLDSYYRSEEFQGRLRHETERIRSQVLGKTSPGSIRTARRKKEKPDSENRSKGLRLCLFLDAHADGAQLRRLRRPSGGAEDRAGTERVR